MVNLPLYKCTMSEQRSMPENANTGLWYDKFFNEWGQGFDKLQSKDTSKRNWIKTVSREVGDSELIRIHAERRKRMVEHTYLFRTTGHFVTGLGRNHPVENGFAWHHTLGTPFLPGSSVKGIVRDWATENEIDKEYINRIFGPDGKDAKAVGSVIFLDAIPNAPVKLTEDVMTPHYGPYYSGGKEIPGDWHDPTPIPFLVVDTDQEFLFGLMPRNEEAQGDLELVEDWLTNALEQAGAGAKTAVGYGRFEYIDIPSEEEEWIKDIARAHGHTNEDALIVIPGVILDAWQNVDDEAKKQTLADMLKKQLQANKTWDKKAWGKVEKLRKALRDFFGE